MTTYAISGMTVFGVRRTVARNVREDEIEETKARLAENGVSFMDAYPEAF